MIWREQISTTIEGNAIYFNQIGMLNAVLKWGHDFRPDYKFLGALKGMFPEVRMDLNILKGRL